MFLHFRRRPLYIYFISEDEFDQGKTIISFAGYGKYFYSLFHRTIYCIGIFYLENLLNSSKSTNETVARPSVQLEDDDPRHERTGSVKFADQAEESKEVNILFLSNDQNTDSIEFIAKTQYSPSERSSNLA